MGVFPRDPRGERYALGADVHSIDREGNSAKHVCEREDHKSQIAIDAQGRGGRDERLELHTSDKEGTKSKAGIDERDDANEDRPHVEQEIGWESVVGHGVAPNIFEDVEPVCVHDCV